MYIPRYWIRQMAMTKEQKAEYDKKYQAANRETILAQNKEYYEANKESHMRRNAQRRALLSNYQMTDFDKFALEEAFILARLREEIMGGIWHVDHIVPVKHPDACGLNSAANLQVVPAVWNLSKGNRSMALWNGVSSTKASSVSS